jgi:hypothetical protein
MLDFQHDSPQRERIAARGTSPQRRSAMNRRVLVVVLAVLSAASAPSLAQTPAARQQQRLAVFLDCHADCDFDLIRQEVTYVDWLRERTAVDVHLLVTSLATGAGGSEYSLAFLGQRAMAGRGDTLRFTVGPTATNDEQRRLLARVVAAGLAPFMVRSGNVSLLRISAAELQPSASRAAPTRDPWKAWVFEVGLEGGLNGEARYKNRSLDGSFDARRITEAWKYELEAEYDYEEDRVTDQEFDDQGNVVSEETFRSLRRSWNIEQVLVKSLTNHASAGIVGNLQSNTFSNLRRGLEAGPAFEYNVFPYSESTRRELIARYSIGYSFSRYVDTTIFDRVRETLPLHVIVLNYRTQAPWGSMSFRAEHRNYLTDAAKRNTDLNGSFDVRVFRGLEVGLFGGYSWIRDQLALRKGGSSQVDVLLRRNELLTSYEYYGGLSLSYTFGSIFNNVVNPRF